MSENDKNVPLIVCDFHTKWGKRDTLSFSKEEISRFHIWNFESGRSLGRNVNFFQFPWDNPGLEVPERRSSEEGRGKRRDLWQNATSLCETAPIKWESPESAVFCDWLVEVQTFKRRGGTMQMCLNSFQRNLVKMAEVLFAVRHFELACKQLAEGKRKRETRRNGQGFPFPNTGDLCRIQINYSGRKHNLTKIPVILHKLQSYEVDLTIYHKIRKSVN